MNGLRATLVMLAIAIVGAAAGAVQAQQHTVNAPDAMPLILDGNTPDDLALQIQQIEAAAEQSRQRAAREAARLSRAHAADGQAQPQAAAPATGALPANDRTRAHASAARREATRLRTTQASQD